MNPYGFEPRYWAMLVALELSELIGHRVLALVPPPRRAAAESFADEQWALVGRLERFTGHRTARQMPSLRAAVEALAAQVATLELPEQVAALVRDKLGEIRAAIEEWAESVGGR